MRAYLKPEFDFVSLRVEERYAGSVVCTIIGSCPDTSAPGCAYDYNGTHYISNQEAP